MIKVKCENYKNHLHSVTNSSSSHLVQHKDGCPVGCCTHSRVETDQYFRGIFVCSLFTEAFAVT